MAAMQARRTRLPHRLILYSDVLQHVVLFLGRFCQFIWRINLFGMKTASSLIYLAIVVQSNF